MVPPWPWLLKRRQSRSQEIREEESEATKGKRSILFKIFFKIGSCFLSATTHRYRKYDNQNYVPNWALLSWAAEDVFFKFFFSKNSSWRWEAIQITVRIDVLSVSYLPRHTFELPRTSIGTSLYIIYTTFRTSPVRPFIIAKRSIEVHTRLLMFVIYFLLV